VGRGRVALQSVNRAGLSRAQRHPILRDVLERDEKLFATLHRHGMQFVAASELALECEFAHELFLIAARPPHSDVRFRGHALGRFVSLGQEQNVDGLVEKTVFTAL
jgi:hypothetical protein